jgi:uncharacterized membrane protein
MLAPGSHKNPVTLVITGLILRAIVWSVMLLSILLTRASTSLLWLPALGVGIAIALAVQTILSDVFASCPLVLISRLKLVILWCSTTWRGR